MIKIITAIFLLIGVTTVVSLIGYYIIKLIENCKQNNIEDTKEIEEWEQRTHEQQMYEDGIRNW